MLYLSCPLKVSSIFKTWSKDFVLQTVCEELSKERAAREALKDVVSAAESMLRVARARIATLERQLKDTKAELEAARRKHKDLEQLVKRQDNSRFTVKL